MINAPGPEATVAAWLSYIESIHPASIDMGLDRVRSVGLALGVLSPWSCPIVTVAGTNGKGTTVKSLTTLINTLGYQVGAYTSPHLIDFAERIEINLSPVSDAELINAFILVEQTRVKLKQTLTYFEFTTLAAFCIFKQHPLDVLILEIGLGGRLDAVNILNPDISMITSIGLDHMEYLGDTLDKIALEKGGIIRSNKPVIIGAGANRPSLLAMAEEKHAEIYVRGRDFDDEQISGEGEWANQLFPESVQLAVQALKLLSPTLGLMPHQIKLLLKNIPNIPLKGRFQKRILNQVEWIIDVAHNSHAANWLVEKLNQLPAVPKTHIVWCSFIDKDLGGILAPFTQKRSCDIDRNSTWYIGPLNHPRSATQEQLNCLNKPIFETFEQALNQAYNQAKPSDRIVVFGSFQAANEAFAFIKRIEG
jgi:dihydrofolate synthase/folylpolyglutamate synthase